MINKQCFIKLFFYIFVVFTFLGCMDVIEVKVPQGEELLAVEGVITNQEGPYVIKLSKTAPYFDQTSNPAVSGAIVKLIESDSLGSILKEEVLNEEEPGKYIVTTIRGTIGNHYTLSIKLEDEEYEAKTQIKRVPPIDSVLFKYEKEIKEQDLKAGYIPRYFGPETPGIGDYYRFKIYRNDTLFNEPSDLAITNDELVDGNYIGDLEFREWRFQPNDTIRVEALSITEDTYQFFYEMWIQINNSNQGIFANPIANVRTNVINQNTQSKKRAVGYFYGAGLSFKEGIVKDDKTVIK